MTRRQIQATGPWKTLLLVALASGSVAGQAFGQGMLVDVRPNHDFRLPRPIVHPHPSPPRTSYRIESLAVNARLNDSTAQVQVSQTFKNTGSAPIEASFVFPLPYDGAVEQLTLLVDGQEFAGKILSKEEARRRYEEIVRANRDPALLEWLGCGMYQTSVFPIPPGATRTVTLRYAQICRKSHGLVDFLFPLSTARYTDGVLERLTVEVAVESPTAIKNVYSPSHNVTIERPDDRHAVVKLLAKQTIPTEDFRLFYDAGQKAVGASVVAYRPEPNEDGYFLLLASPDVTRDASDEADGARQGVAAKTVVFVVDRSGSMSGEKMEQAKEALKFVLNNLREGDTFNIVAYDSQIEAFRPELEKFNDDTRAAAIGFVNGLFAGGSTNIDGALSRALGMLVDKSRPAYVIFLTDGLPTVGEMSEATIVDRARRDNDANARIFAFGVGYDVNSRLLDKLARVSRGQSDYVRPNEDIEAAVSSLYRRIGAPVMTDVELAVDVEGASTTDGPTISRVYPQGPFDLFAGDQAVIVGRYRAPGAAKATLSGTVNGTAHMFAFPVDLTARSDDDANAFVAKLWATRRVGEIIDEIDLKGRNEELVKELVDLAMKHGILTPYTSFLADETGAPRDGKTRLEAAASAVEQLNLAEGRFAFRQRLAKSELQSAARPATTAAAGGYGGEGEAPRDYFFFGESLERLAETSGKGVVYYEAKRDRQIVAGGMISVGRKTFVRRGDRWVDSTVAEDEEQSAKKIERFSPEYFELVARHGKHVAQYLALDGPTVVKLEGKVYAW